MIPTLIDVLLIPDLHNIIAEYAQWHMYKLRPLNRTLHRIIPENKISHCMVRYECDITFQPRNWEIHTNMSKLFALDAQYDKMICLLIRAGEMYGNCGDVMLEMVVDLFALENTRVYKCLYMYCKSIVKKIFASWSERFIKMFVNIKNVARLIDILEPFIGSDDQIKFMADSVNIADKNLVRSRVLTGEYLVRLASKFDFTDHLNQWAIELIRNVNPIIFYRSVGYRKVSWINLIVNHNLPFECDKVYTEDHYISDIHGLSQAAKDIILHIAILNNRSVIESLLSQGAKLDPAHFSRYRNTNDAVLVLLHGWGMKLSTSEALRIFKQYNGYNKYYSAHDIIRNNEELTEIIIHILNGRSRYLKRLSEYFGRERVAAICREVHSAGKWPQHVDFAPYE